ncbi:MAG: enoyl-CoA hydratase/carnithine racemase [Myxococcales bacterium]|nr:enoyl-CoA hydratase/carnithine racemase [Myxococcales bacterium]
MAEVRVATEHRGALLRVTLCAPPAERLASATLRALAAALEAVDAGTKLVVFDADGDDFSLGGDATPGELHALFRRLIDIHVPTAAVVRGACLGAALELAAFCNFVFASSDARFGACPLPAFVLPLKLGQGNAEDLVVCGDTLSAAEAYRRGLVLATAPASLVGTLSDTWLAAHVLNKTAASLRRANRVARAAFHGSLMLHAAAFDLAASARAYSASHVPRLHRS